MASSAPEGAVYIILVTGKVKKGQAAAFTEAFTPLANHVTANEPGCLSYKLCFSEDDPDAFIIWERYTSKDYLENVHWKSEPFAQFRADLAAKGVEWETKTVAKYWETGPGFPTR